MSVFRRGSLGGDILAALQQLLLFGPDNVLWKDFILRKFLACKILHRDYSSAF